MDEETRIEWMYQAWSQVQQGIDPEPFYDMVAKEFNCSVKEAKTKCYYIVKDRPTK